MKRALYNPSDDKLYVKSNTPETSGSYDNPEEGSEMDLPIVFESGEMTFDSIDEKKYLFRIRVKYQTSLSSNSGGLLYIFKDERSNPIGDGSIALADSLSPTLLIKDLVSFESFNTLRYKVEGKVTIYEINFDFEPATGLKSEQRFEYADVCYEGSSLTVQLYIDNEAIVSTPNHSSSALPASSESPRTVRLYYANDTRGIVPHYVQGGTGIIHSVDYKTTAI